MKLEASEESNFLFKGGGERKTQISEEANQKEEQGWTLERLQPGGRQARPRRQQSL